jgi:hypothetical protein
MLVFSRAAARAFRALLRRSVMAAAPRGPCPPILAVADGAAVTLQAVGHDVGLSLRAPPTPGSPGQLAFPGELLARVEGTADTPVTLELVSPDSGLLRWEDKHVPQQAEFVPLPADQLPALLDVPQRWTALSPTFLEALDNACRTSVRHPPRYALDHVQLRGKAGQLVASDGKQLLVQGGWKMPFADEVLVPAVPVFAARELTGADVVRLGRAGPWLVVEAGPWSVHLKVNAEGRFPDVQRVIPRDPDRTCLLLDEADAEFLMDALPGLPGAADEAQPLTLDLGKEVVVRARSDEQPPSEVLLARSEVKGAPLRLCLNRKLLFRALRLGFRIFGLQDAAKPIVARDGDRLFVTVPLDAKAALASTPDSVRVCSGPANPDHPRPIEKEEVVMTTPNGNHNGRASEPPSALDPLEEVEALKLAMQEALNRCTRLTASLRQFRKQRKVVESAVASLRQFNFSQ